MLYPEEFRKKVMEYIDGYYSQAQVARMFKISPKTVWNWVKQKKESGHLKPKKVERKSSKINAEELLAYVKEHPDAYLREIAAQFNCGTSAIHRKLKKLGYTYKKTIVVQRKRREATSGIP